MKELFFLLRWKLWQLVVYPKYLSYKKGKRSIRIIILHDQYANTLSKGYIRIIRMGYRSRNAKFLYGGINKDGIQYGMYEVDRDIQKFSFEGFCEIGRTKVENVRVEL